MRRRFGSHQGHALDFNRFGVTVVLSRPIPVNKPLFVTLRYRGMRLEQIVGAAHHCRFDTNLSFRCGIRFRTNSPEQLDREEIEAQLEALERELAEASISAT